MKNVLIIDDNKDILESIRKGLSNRLKDCRILTSVNGESCEQILKAEPIDLIVADLEMPALNGYHFIEKARRELPSIPLCVMMGSCPRGVIEQLRILGVTRIIGKPFLLDRLADVIAEELNPEAGVFSPGTGNA
jgi:two-component system response regulator YesN